MRPAIVLPLHDPDGVLLPHLAAVTPQLKAVFAEAFVSLTLPTCQAQGQLVSALQHEPFFQLCYFDPDCQPIGDRFRSLYAQAAAACTPGQVVHLCFPDRVCFALLSHHRAAFLADIATLQPERTPWLFQRSSAAWSTHPQNYFEIEQWATRTGELLFGRSLDFTWCHLALEAQRLRAVLPLTHSSDLSFVAEIVVALRETIRTQAVDWLAWEDPFIYGREPEALKRERESDPRETHKRLAYIVPTLEHLLRASEPPAA